jgi:starvation-inducible DNA-binding protein
MTATMTASTKPSMKPGTKFFANTVSPPQPLAMPTDLGAERVRALSKTVNSLIADSLALHLKTKNFRWQLSALHCKEYHQLFDDQANQLLESVGILAEQVRKLGTTTLHSVLHITALQQSIDDYRKATAPCKMVQQLLADNNHMVRSQHAAITVCDIHHDWQTSNILQTLLNKSEHRIWLLFEIARYSPLST